MQTNPSCHFYWLNEYFRTRGCMYEVMVMTHPSEHILQPADLQAIKFPPAAVTVANPCHESVRRSGDRC